MTQPFYPQVKTTYYPLSRSPGVPKSRPRSIGQAVNILPQPLFEPRPVQPIACSLYQLRYPTFCICCIWIDIMYLSLHCWLLRRSPIPVNCCTDISFAVLSTDGSAHVSALKFYDIDVNRFFWASFGIAFHLTCKLRLNTCGHRDHKACFFVVRSSAKLRSVA